MDRRRLFFAFLNNSTNIGELVARYLSLTPIMFFRA